ncbi:hypothetical protein ACHAW5_007246 [Stephanodiscus triporus]|uniref:Uncharacterized protein n=1 Tax=Stephanodiscus triporus TaxID=2934178 RepID=A0ABD3N5M7_9STRA
MTNPCRILPTMTATATAAAAFMALSSAPSIGAFAPPGQRRQQPRHPRRRPASASASTALRASPGSTGGAAGGERTPSSSGRRERRRYPASTVSDPHGPTPHLEADPFPEVDIDALPEMHYDESNHPVPHQPWRRGDTDGCHDPLTAPWRLEAEAIIADAVGLVGGSVVDVTWYMAKCVISLDERSLRNVVGYVDGPEVRIVYPDDSDVVGHVWDPNAPGGNNGDDDMEEMYTEEDEILDFEQYDEDTEYEILKANMPVEYDESTGKELPPREPRSREERAHDMREEWESRFLDEPRIERPNDGMFSHPVDTKALSVVSQAITTALSVEDVEDRLRILSRHDVVLTSPLDNPCVLDSQREFDDAIGLDVYVETRDPWGSNRVLFGKLVDRNALDVVINQDNAGRMVTIPHSMIHQVLLPSGLARGSARIKAGLTEDDDDGEEDDEDGEEGDDEYDDGGEDGGDDDDDDDNDEDDGGYLDVEEEEVFE